jgi:hypothetical protein
MVIGKGWEGDGFGVGNVLFWGWEGEHELSVLVHC